MVLLRTGFLLQMQSLLFLRPLTWEGTILLLKTRYGFYSFTRIILSCIWGHDSAPDGSSPRGCEQSLVIGCSRESLALSCTSPCVIGSTAVLPMGVASEAASNHLWLAVALILSSLHCL